MKIAAIGSFLTNYNMDRNGCSSFRFCDSLDKRGASRVRKPPYDSPSLLTIFRVPRRLGRDEEAGDGTVSGTQ